MGLSKSLVRHLVEPMCTPMALYTIPWLMRSLWAHRTTWGSVITSTVCLRA